MATITPKYLTEDVLNYFAQWAKENLETFTPEDYEEAMLLLHPIGSYYWSEDSTNPGKLFGGTWISIYDCYMYATNNTGTGGSSSVTLTSAHMPSHSHTMPSHTHNMELHNHSIGVHNHSVPNSTHTHTLGHTHPTIYTVMTATWSIGGHRSTGGYNVFTSKQGSKTSNGTGDYASPTVTFSTNASTSTQSARGSITLESGGSGTSGGANTLSVNTNSGSNYTFTLDPPYINAYCWYRSG